VSFLSGLLQHRGTEMMSREQNTFFIRDAQNGLMEMGKLIQQIADTGHPDISQHCSRLLKLNSHVGNVLEHVQKSIQ